MDETEWVLMPGQLTPEIEMALMDADEVFDRMLRRGVQPRPTQAQFLRDAVFAIQIRATARA